MIPTTREPMILEFNNQRMSFSNTRGDIRSRRSWISSLLIIGMVCIAAAITGSAAQAAPKTISEQMMVPLSLDGEQVRLAVRVYRPEGAGPFPTLIYHHGSTGWGNKPELFAQFWPPVGVIEYFTSRGWCVVAPSRRGRGGSEGLYDEGFTPERDYYSIAARYSLPGADRALTDIDAVTDVILEWPFVDPERVVVSGISRGGILSVAHSGQRPDLYRGVINFVGGWLGGKDSNIREINQKLFNRGVPYGKEILWLYASDDWYYSLSTTRKYFKKFIKAGGKGSFFDDFPKGIGHGAAAFPEHWGPVVETYLTDMGIDLEEASHSTQFQPDPTLSADAFVGNWKRAYEGTPPSSVRISKVSSAGKVKGKYRYGKFKPTKLKSRIKNGVLKHAWKSGDFIKFFLASEDLMAATYASEKKDGRRDLYRFYLKREPN